MALSHLRPGSQAGRCPWIVRRLSAALEVIHHPPLSQLCRVLAATLLTHTKDMKAVAQNISAMLILSRLEFPLACQLVLITVQNQVFNANIKFKIQPELSAIIALPQVHREGAVMEATTYQHHILTLQDHLQSTPAGIQHLMTPFRLTACRKSPRQGVWFLEVAVLVPPQTGLHHLWEQVKYTTFLFHTQRHRLLLDHPVLTTRSILSLPLCQRSIRRSSFQSPRRPPQSPNRVVAQACRTHARIRLCYAQ